MFKYDKEKVKKLGERFFRKLEEVTGFTVSEVNPPSLEYLKWFDDVGQPVFRIKEIPEWLFSIWFDDDNVSGAFFGQFEDAIDKFKPSASMYSFDFRATGEKDEDGDPTVCDSDLCRVASAIRYIAAEPEMAFYRDVFYADYNEQLVTKEEARLQYVLYKRDQELRERLSEYLGRQAKKFVEEELVPKGGILESAKVEYDEEHRHYSIIVPYEGNEARFPKGPGEYYWDIEELEPLEKKLKEFGELFGVFCPDRCWERPINCCLKAERKDV